MPPDEHDPRDAARHDTTAERGHGGVPGPHGPSHADWHDPDTRPRGPRVPAFDAGAGIGPTAQERLDALEAALRTSRARYYAGDRTPDPALEAAVCAAAHALRAEGWSVLDVLRAVKARLSGAAGSPTGGLPASVAEAAVRWCIAHYFDPPPGGAAAPARDGSS